MWLCQGEDAFGARTGGTDVEKTPDLAGVLSGVYINFSVQNTDKQKYNEICRCLFSGRLDAPDISKGELWQKALVDFAAKDLKTHLDAGFSATNDMPVDLVTDP